MQIFKNYDQVLRGIMAAFWYNRDDKDLIDTLEQVKRRLSGYKKYEKPIDDADIISSILVYTYGDYGTSPRYGWFDNAAVPQAFIEVIDSYINEIKENMGEQEDD
jgi:hypothetical protein